MRRSPRIGLFGGTFDPIHSGHLHAVRLVQRRFALDRVFFIPAAVPPHKARPDLASARDRLRMTALAVKGHSRWTASPIELRAAGPSYSIRTIEAMRRRFPQARLFFIVGADAFLEIETWREWERVLHRCAFIVMTRPGARLGAAAGALGPEWKTSLHRIGRVKRRGELDGDPPCIYFAAIDALPVSSTRIRALARNGAALKGLVPGTVAAYIRKKRIYREKSAVSPACSFPIVTRRSEKSR
jgi:nicotinate-nucleotide adenylyltransferase